MVLEVYVTFRKVVIIACLKVPDSVSGQHSEDSASYCRGLCPALSDGSKAHRIFLIQFYLPALITTGHELLGVQHIWTHYEWITQLSS